MLRFKSETELEYHLMKADRSICPGRWDFNSLYTEYNNEKYGLKNGREMFVQLDKIV